MKIQRCVKCDEPTGRCEEDALYRGSTGPYCEEYFDISSQSSAVEENPIHTFAQELINNILTPPPTTRKE